MSKLLTSTVFIRSRPRFLNPRQQFLPAQFLHNSVQDQVDVFIVQSGELAAAAFVPVATTQALTNLGSGFLVERIRLRTLLALALTLQALALWLAPHLGPGWFALLYGLNLGAVFGLQRTVSSVAWAKYFGRLHLGAIAGFSSTILVGASALGPMPMGIARDLLGSYTTTLNLLGFIPLVLAGASLFVDRPQRREEQ